MQCWRKNEPFICVKIIIVRYLICGLKIIVSSIVRLNLSEKKQLQWSLTQSTHSPAAELKHHM